MQIHREEFRERLQQGRLAIAFIGMSNIGKSHRSRELRMEKGFESVSIDDRIASTLGLDGIEGVSRWMGYPNEADYGEKEGRYLRAEEEAVKRLAPPRGKNFVVDTTGSVIYLPEDLLADLRRRYLVVHLEVNPRMIPGMIKRYLDHPKPVIWGGKFHQAADETFLAALQRCYPAWLQYRLGRYQAIADLSVSGEAATDPKVSIDQFLKVIEAELPA